MLNIQADGSASSSGVVFNKGQTTTVYFVGGFGNNTEQFKLFSGLSQLKIQAEGTKNEQPCTLTKTLTASGDKVLATGNIYRLSATLVEGDNN
jgi:phage baseplate assembly protein gpV